MASKLYINEIVSRNGLYTLANTATFDANNHVTIDSNAVSLFYQTNSNALSISQSGSGNALAIGELTVGGSGIVTSGTLSPDVTFPTGQMRIINFSQIPYTSGIVNETNIFSFTATSTDFKVNSKLYLTASISLERVSSENTDSAQLSIESDQMSTILVDGALGYQKTMDEKIHLTCSALTNSIPASSSTFNIKIHDFVGTAEFNVNSGTVTIFEVYI